MLVLAIKLSKNKKTNKTPNVSSMLAKKQQRPTTHAKPNTGKPCNRNKRNDWVQMLHLQNEIEESAQHPN